MTTNYNTTNYNNANYNNLNSNDFNGNRSGRIMAVGRYADNDDIHSGYNNNDMIIGCSGSGYVIPNIRQHYGSMIITDTKGQLFRMLSGELEKAGYKVFLIDFSEPERSMRYNPLSYIRRKARSSPGKQGKNGDMFNNKDIVSIAHAMCPVRTEKDPFWEDSARTVLTFLIAFVMEALVPEEHDMISVLEMYRQIANPNGRKAIELWCDEHPDSFATRKYGMFRGIYDSERTWACISQFLAEALDIFDFAEIRNLFRCKTDRKGSQQSQMIDLQKIGIEKTAVFLNVSDTDRYADRLINLFYTQAMQVLCSKADQMPKGRLTVPVRFILDDFAANAYIENFDKLISVIRSRNISVSVILQNMTQLYSMYSDAQASTILNNCDHILYLGGQDITTAEYIGKRSNKTEEHVLLMPFDKAYLIVKGKRGELVDKITPYADENQKSASSKSSQAVV